jgi:hypothetical protein
VAFKERETMRQGLSLESTRTLSQVKRCSAHFIHTRNTSGVTLCERGGGGQYN